MLAGKPIGVRKVRFVTAHRGGVDTFEKSPLYKSVGGKFDIYLRPENAEGLPAVYNRYLREDYDYFRKYLVSDEQHRRDDIIAFVHDDVELYSYRIAEELNCWIDAGFSILGPIGAAGLAVRAPAFWVQMAPRGAARGAQSSITGIKMAIRARCISFLTSPTACLRTHTVRS